MNKKLLCSLIFLFSANIIVKSQVYPIIVKSSNKWGCVDLDGNFIIQPNYKWCHGFTEDGTVVVSKDNKLKDCLLFDYKGNQIISEINIKIEQDFFTGVK